MRSNDGLTARDKDIIKMTSEFGGKTFVEVLAKTYWINSPKGLQIARNRIIKLKKMKMMRHVETGLMNPRNAIALTAFCKRWVADNMDLEVPQIFLSPVTVWHTIYEQISWYWIRQTGREVSREIVKRWSVDHKHTPDLLYFHNDKPVYVEIELNKKSNDRYVDLISKSRQDGVKAMLYIFENEKKMYQLGRLLPISDLIHITNIDALIESVKNTGKIGQIKQSDFLKKLEQHYKK